MKIGELSALTNVSTDTLRFYEKQGLIRATRRDNGYRDFDEDTVRLVGLVRLGQKLGFHLKEMQQITETVADGEMSAQETEQMLQAKLADVDQKIDELIQLKGILIEAIKTVCPLRG